MKAYLTVTNNFASDEAYESATKGLFKVTDESPSHKTAD